MNKSEEKLKRAAELYTKKAGESLLKETEEIRRSNVSYITPRADKAVRELMAEEKLSKRRSTQQPKQRKMIFGFCAAAACVIITFALISGVPGFPGGGSGGGAPEASDSGSGGAAAEAPAEAPDPGAATPAPAPGPVMPTEIMPITFTLPADFRVENVELDNGMSVYNLESDVYGSVVLTMIYKTDGAGEDFFEGFDEVIIDGAAVPAKVRDTYKLLAFNFGNVFYTLSSEDDLGSLAAFYRNIEKYSRDL
jgi:hypothetical protein